MASGQVSGKLALPRWASTAQAHGQQVSTCRVLPQHQWGDQPVWSRWGLWDMVLRALTLHFLPVVAEPAPEGQDVTAARPGVAPQEDGSQLGQGVQHARVQLPQLVADQVERGQAGEGQEGFRAQRGEVVAAEVQLLQCPKPQQRPAVDHPQAVVGQAEQLQPRQGEEGARPQHSDEVVAQPQGAGVGRQALGHLAEATLAAVHLLGRAAADSGAGWRGQWVQEEQDKQASQHVSGGPPAAHGFPLRQRGLPDLQCRDSPTDRIPVPVALPSHRPCPALSVPGAGQCQLQGEQGDVLGSVQPQRCPRADRRHPPSANPVQAVLPAQFFLGWSCTFSANIFAAMPALARCGAVPLFPPSARHCSSQVGSQLCMVWD